jgi:pyruvate carboxylase subunit B
VPSKVYETIKQARKILPGETFIHFHTHETAGIGMNANKAALDGGADAIDLSMAPCSGGTCQTDILVMWHALRGTDYELDVDINKVREAEEVFKDCMKEYFLPPEALAVEPLIPWCPMPGGALTANTQMLRDNGIMEKYPEIIKSMSEVVRLGGYGTSVTPVSQCYFQQAFNNVMFGPWKKIAPDYGKMVLGYFGKTPVPADSEIVKIAAEQLKMEPTKRSPIEMNDENPDKSIDHARKTLQSSGIDETEENIFIVATCKEKGLKFLKGEAELGIRKISENSVPDVVTKDDGNRNKPSDYVVTVNGKDYPIRIEGDKAIVNKISYQIEIRRDDEPKPKVLAEGTGTSGTEVTAQMPGKVIRLSSRIGDYLHPGQSIMVVEAMKMEVHVSSPIEGTVTDIKVAAEDQVTTGQVLAIIK